MSYRQDAWEINWDLGGVNRKQQGDPASPRTGGQWDNGVHLQHRAPPPKKTLKIPRFEKNCRAGQGRAGMRCCNSGSPVYTPQKIRTRPAKENSESPLTFRAADKSCVQSPQVYCVALPKARWPGVEVGAAAGAGAELPGVFHPGRSCPRCGCPSGGPLSGGRGRWRCSPRRRPPPCPRQAGEPSLQMCWLRGLALTAQVMGRPLEGGALGPVVAPGLCEEDRRTYGTGRWAAPSRRPASSCISPAVGSCWGLAGQAGAGGVPAAGGPAGPQNARAAVRLSTRRPPSHPEARCGCATRRLPSPS